MALCNILWAKNRLRGLRSDPFILKLPRELVGQIISFLPIEDQVCLSLSSKYFLNFLLSYLGIKNLSELLPYERYSPLHPNVESRPRVKLLRRLQNRRWECCLECWKLHPVSSQGPRQHPYCSRCHEMHGRDCSGHDLCMPYAGYVEICPCLIMSFRDEFPLIKGIMTPLPHYFEGVLYSYIGPPRRLTHYCTFEHPQGPMVGIETTFHICERGNLVVSSSYVFRFEPHGSPSATKTQFMCPHEDPNRWLKTFFVEAGSSFSGWRHRYGTPRSCNCLNVFTLGPHTFEISYERDLGNTDWPNKEWDEHCRF